MVAPIGAFFVPIYIQRYFTPCHSCNSVASTHKVVKQRVREMPLFSFLAKCLTTMKENTNSTGLIPVTIQLPAEIAERIQKGNYDFRPLFELLDGESLSPNDIADNLLSAYFSYTQVLSLRLEEIVVGGPELKAQLDTLERLYRMFKDIAPAASAGDEGGK